MIFVNETIEIIIKKNLELASLKKKDKVPDSKKIQNKMIKNENADLQGNSTYIDYNEPKSKPLKNPKIKVVNNNNETSNENSNIQQITETKTILNKNSKINKITSENINSEEPRARPKILKENSNILEEITQQANGKKQLILFCGTEDQKINEVFPEKEEIQPFAFIKPHQFEKLELDENQENEEKEDIKGEELEKENMNTMNSLITINLNGNFQKTVEKCSSHHILEENFKKDKKKIKKEDLLKMIFHLNEVINIFYFF